MCDTFVALGNSTRDGSVIFAKNSDREPNEAHEVILVPAADHQPGEMVQCTYVEIPQVEHTHAVLLAKPFWIWGAEMGANEYGLTIGNEAVFTRVPYQKGAGLIGMDFIRLALERAVTAEEAMWVIIGLLEKYGQGGNCGFDHPFYYHNSFLLADTHQAWVLETAGRHWAAEKVKTIRSISNGLTIGAQMDLASNELIPYAIDRGWCKSKADFDFARCYADPLYTGLSNLCKRKACTTGAMQAAAGQLTPEHMFAFLRSHGLTPGKPRNPGKGILGAEVCMHAGFGPVRASQSVGSMVSYLREGAITHWVTATSAPCTSVFKPVWFTAGLPDMGPAPAGKYDLSSLYWRHELLHRTILRSYPQRIASFSGQRDELEARFYQNAGQIDQAHPEELRSYSKSCFREADQLDRNWLEAAGAIAEQGQGILYQLAWNGYNKKAGLPHLERESHRQAVKQA